MQNQQLNLIERQDLANILQINVRKLSDFLKQADLRNVKHRRLFTEEELSIAINHRKKTLTGGLFLM